MPRSASIAAGLLGLLSLALTLYLFNSAELPQDRNILLGFLIGEGIYFTWLVWSFAQPEETTEPDPIPLPRARQPEVIPTVPTYAPLPRPSSMPSRRWEPAQASLCCSPPSLRPRRS